MLNQIWWFKWWNQASIIIIKTKWKKNHFGRNYPSIHVEYVYLCGILISKRVKMLRQNWFETDRQIIATALKHQTCGVNNFLGIKIN